ncbi:MAG: FAD-dependent oxidoreductase [Desulfobacteraceae bacterium]|nr:FAD-dependent oxidoreductase [Desulfobacteraceae bacterium]
MYPNLFSPITINTLEIKNRIAYPSLGLLYSYDRKLNDKYYNFYAHISQGGAGIVTAGPVGVDYIGSGIIMLGLDNDEEISSFRKLAKIIKSAGAKPWIQLFHGGAYVYPFLIDNQQPIAPSAVFSRYSKTEPRQMTLEDIQKVQEAFAAAAVRAREAEFEGVEIIGSAGYLISQFLSGLKNQRTDKYGGSFENRTRFARELIMLVRERLGKDFPITIRMAGNDFVSGSNTDLEAARIARVYEKAGVDALNVTGGWHESRVPQLPMDLPRAGYAYLARNIRQMVSIPVMASNRITTPEDAENLLKDGSADMVNLGRVLIADPQWPLKAKQGRAREIRPCVACSQGCTDEVFNGRPVFCVGNARAGFENERKIEKTQNPKRVLVAGAGPAGLEAAVTAAKAGHQVEIMEKQPDIGGQIHLAGAPPHKRELLEFIRYYYAMIEKYHIPVTFNTEVTAETIRDKKPDHLIIAEGAQALTPPIEGTDDPKVLSSWHVLKNNPVLGKDVAIIGGNAVGLETAVFVASKGTLGPEMVHFLLTYDTIAAERLRELMFTGTSTVTVFEMLPKAGKDVGKSTKWILMSNLDRYGVTVKTQTTVVSVKNGQVIYKNGADETQSSQHFDHIILASGSEPRQKLTRQAKTLGIPYTCIGDCVSPRKLNNAIHEGFLAALAIKEI